MAQFELGAGDITLGDVTVGPPFSDSGDVVQKALVDGDRHLQVDVLTSPPIATSAADADNNYGTTTSLANGATGTLVSIPSTSAGYKVTGLSCTGNGDGYFFVTVAGSTILSGRTRYSQPSMVVSLPNPISISTASAVTLKVTNESGSTADFEATLLGA